MKKLISCGVCDQFHPKGFDGDCRDNDNRFPTDDPTIVVFRKWPVSEKLSGSRLHRDRISGGIIALFPRVPGSPGFCSSYEHIGQHGDADYSGVVSITVPATPEEYADLKRELEGPPYNYILRVAKRSR
jgi:hypothetical protein